MTRFQGFETEKQALDFEKLNGGLLCSQFDPNTERDHAFAVTFGGLSEKFKYSVHWNDSISLADTHYILFDDEQEKWYRIVGDWKAEDDLFEHFPNGFSLYQVNIGENGLIESNDYSSDQDGEIFKISDYQKFEV